MAGKLPDILWIMSEQPRAWSECEHLGAAVAVVPETLHRPVAGACGSD